MNSLPAVARATAPIQQPAQRDLAAAMLPYRVGAPLAVALDEVDVEGMQWIAHTNTAGDLWVVWDADGDPKILWRHADKAASYLERLPRLADVLAVHEVVRADLDTAPSLETRVELICLMLDAQNITTATETYVRMLAEKLGSSLARATETHERKHRWFPMAAIAAAIDEVITTVKTGKGRPIDIASMLDLCGKHSSELVGLEARLRIMATALPILARITDAVTDVPRPSNMRRRGWQPPPMGPDEEPLPF